MEPIKPAGALPASAPASAPTTPAPPPTPDVTPSAGTLKSAVNTGVAALKQTPAMLSAEGTLVITTSGAQPVISVHVVPPGQKEPLLMQGAIAAYNASGIGIFAQAPEAGHFVGAVTVTGPLSAQDVVLVNADCAEDFDVCALAAPGDVMVLDDAGALVLCSVAYDRRAAGVVSGAGDYRPAITLDRRGGPVPGRLPIALVGKVACKVDASHGAIAVGDLLTTSPTPGHAMKASDPARAHGAIIGKALRPLAAGQDLVPILVALQ
ncbi:MAG TPA: hypothetical protein VGF94_15230 [Kofleriaceae bacterium]|jgi:hypothetical protein